MRILFLLLAATISLVGPANAFSILSETEPGPPAFWGYVFLGFADVTSDVTVGNPNSAALRQNIPSTFFLQTIFDTTGGPINSSTFNGVVNPLDFVSTSTQGVIVTTTLTGFGPGGADDPIFTHTLSPGASIFSFSAGLATLNPTLGSISGFQEGSLLGGLASLNLSQNGYGSFVFTDGSASRTVTFATEPEFNGLSFSPAVSAVPLPPALPMFASALLALGIFGFYARRKQAPLSAPLSLS